MRCSAAASGITTVATVTGEVLLAELVAAAADCVKFVLTEMVGELEVLVVVVLVVVDVSADVVLLLLMLLLWAFASFLGGISFEGFSNGYRCFCLCLFAHTLSLFLILFSLLLILFFVMFHLIVEFFSAFIGFSLAFPLY